MLLSAVVFGAWCVTQVTWLSWLRSANGRRPFIELTMRVGWAMTALSAFFVIFAIVRPPDEPVSWVLGLYSRAVSAYVCFAMWKLHERVHH